MRLKESRLIGLLDRIELNKAVLDKARIPIAAALLSVFCAVYTTGCVSVIEKNLFGDSSGYDSSKDWDYNSTLSAAEEKI